ncbi:unnamed protein product [Amoebophrya sp. A25]|nr:unnamed protein product [Amoebophrya sp. A25]|eukprot:GSA25T00014709001.1
MNTSTMSIGTSTGLGGTTGALSTGPLMASTSSTVVPIDGGYENAPGVVFSGSLRNKAEPGATKARSRVAPTLAAFRNSEKPRFDTSAVWKPKQLFDKDMKPLSSYTANEESRGASSPESSSVHTSPRKSLGGRGSGNHLTARSRNSGRGSELLLHQDQNFQAASSVMKGMTVGEVAAEIQSRLRAEFGTLEIAAVHAAMELHLIDSEALENFISVKKSEIDNYGGGDFISVKKAELDSCGGKLVQLQQQFPMGFPLSGGTRRGLRPCFQAQQEEEIVTPRWLQKQLDFGHNDSSSSTPSSKGSVERGEARAGGSSGNTTSRLEFGPALTEQEEEALAQERLSRCLPPIRFSTQLFEQAILEIFGFDLTAKNCRRLFNLLDREQSERKGYVCLPMLAEYTPERLAAQRRGKKLSSSSTSANTRGASSRTSGSTRASSSTFTLEAGRSGRTGASSTGDGGFGSANFTDMCPQDYEEDAEIEPTHGEGAQRHSHDIFSNSLRKADNPRSRVVQSGGRSRRSGQPKGSKDHCAGSSSSSGKNMKKKQGEHEEIEGDYSAQNINLNLLDPHYEPPIGTHQLSVIDEMEENICSPIALPKALRSNSSSIRGSAPPSHSDSITGGVEHEQGGQNKQLIGLNNASQVVVRTTTSSSSEESTSSTSQGPRVIGPAAISSTSSSGPTTTGTSGSSNKFNLKLAPAPTFRWAVPRTVEASSSTGVVTRSNAAAGVEQHPQYVRADQHQVIQKPQGAGQEHQQDMRNSDRDSGVVNFRKQAAGGGSWWAASSSQSHPNQQHHNLGRGATPGGGQHQQLQQHGTMSRTYQHHHQQPAPTILPAQQQHENHMLAAQHHQQQQSAVMRQTSSILQQVPSFSMGGPPVFRTASASFPLGTVPQMNMVQAGGQPALVRTHQHVVSQPPPSQPVAASSTRQQQSKLLAPGGQKAQPLAGGAFQPPGRSAYRA